MDTYNYEFKEKFNYIIRAHKECLIHIYKDLINNITDDKIYEVIYHMVNCLIVNYDDKMIKYLFNHNIFIDKYFLNTDTFNIVENMKKIYPEKDTLIKYNNYSVITKKVLISWGNIMNIFIENIIKFRIENLNDILNEKIIHYYDFNIFGLLSKLPNTIKSFNTIIDNNYIKYVSTDSWVDSSLNTINYAILDSLRYGYIDSIKIMFPKLFMSLKSKLSDKDTLYDIYLNRNTYLKYALYNKDNRVVSFVSQFIEENEPGYLRKSDNEIELSFLEQNRSEENIIKKMKILFKYSDTKKYKWDLVRYTSSIKFSDLYNKKTDKKDKFKLKKWIMKKLLIIKLPMILILRE